MRDDDEAALVGLERRLELLDRLEVEVVRRLVEHEAVDAPAPRAARAPARVRSPGESAARAGRCRRRRARTSRAACAPRPAAGRTPRRSRRAATPEKRSRAWSARRRRPTAPSRRVPRGERQVADERPDQRRLAGAVRADDGEAVAPVQLERRPARAGTTPRSTTAPASSATSVAAARGGRQLELSRHGVHGFSTSSSRSRWFFACCTLPRSAFVARRSEPPVWRASLRSPPSRCAWLRRSREQRRCSAPARRRSRRSRARAAPARARARPRTPTTCRRTRAPCRVSRLDLDDARDRPVEERAVVRDEHDARRRAPSRNRSSRSSPAKSRLFVGSSSRKTSKRASRIAASAARAASPPESGRHLALGARPEADVGQDGAGAGLEVLAAEREEAVERVGVGAARAPGSAPSRAASASISALGGADAGAPREVAEHRLARPRLGLLRQVADGAAADDLAASRAARAPRARAAASTCRSRSGRRCRCGRPARRPARRGRAPGRRRSSSRCHVQRVSPARADLLQSKGRKRGVST